MACLPSKKDAFNQKLYKKAKLTKTDEFSSVFSFRRRLYAEHLMLHFRPNRLGCSRLGLVVAKKVVKTAVARNYIRRVLRELFRVDQMRLNRVDSDTLNFDAVDLVIQVRKKFTRTDFLAIQNEVNYLFSQLIKKKTNIKLSSTSDIISHD